eukprot:GILJ01011520.1.p1 GENE.GILJ01011520.1~~GILJ01011520.1.p1  ORF type:complete len:718 (-),score=84.18 GILJ01011520.1:179-2332(-)
MMFQGLVTVWDITTQPFGGVNPQIKRDEHQQRMFSFLLLFVGLYQTFTVVYCRLYTSTLISWAVLEAFVIPYYLLSRTSRYQHAIYCYLIVGAVQPPLIGILFSRLGDVAKAHHAIIWIVFPVVLATYALDPMKFLYYMMGIGAAFGIYVGETWDDLTLVSPEYALASYAYAVFLCVFLACCQRLHMWYMNAALREKEQFSSCVSHELRTPLNGILGALDVLGESPLTIEQRRMWGVAVSSTENMLSVVDELLDFSKLQFGQIDITLREFDIRQILAEVLDFMQLVATAKKLSLVCEVLPGSPTMTFGDKKRTRQILTNLIGNAIKYTDQGEVRLRLLTHQEGDDISTRVVRVEVHDTGIGLPDNFNKLFKPFVRFTNTKPGTGLGLFLSKVLVEKQGGCIGVQRFSVGSMFWFTLPAVNLVRSSNNLPLSDINLPGSVNMSTSEPASPLPPFRPRPLEYTTIKVETPRQHFEADVATGKEDMKSMAPETVINIAAVWEPVPLRSEDRSTSRPSAGLTRYRILVAEDNMFNQTVIESMLEVINCISVIVPDGVQVCDELMRNYNSYDLVLMDCQMPYRDGFEATQYIRAQEIGRQLGRKPIVALTADASSRTTEACLASGMDAIITKPVRKTTLQQKLTEILNGNLQDGQNGQGVKTDPNELIPPHTIGGNQQVGIEMTTVSSTVNPGNATVNPIHSINNIPHSLPPEDSCVRVSVT